LTALDEDGFLTVPFIEISRYRHVPEAKVEEITKLIQRCDPAGVGSRSPQEALLVQLEVMSETQGIDPIIERAIREGMKLLSKRQYSALGKKLGISAQHAKKVAEFIAENLNPFPARAHWGTVRNQSDSKTNRYHTPDAIIHAQGEKDDIQLVVEILWPIRGSLQINPQFRKAIQDAPTDKAEEWNQALEKASLLIKCLNQRNHTLVQLMQKIALRQRKFILGGDAYLKPTTRAQLADEIGVHESTISRAVANKSVQLPSGQIIPISKFFDRSLHIRTALKKIVAEETKPLSDTKITHLLAEKGYNIARRTVAKYRAMEGILPAHLRGEILNS
jgi:RNA polymerase sigma-54 factor